MPPKKSNNNHLKLRSQIFKTPFKHLIIQNFLSKQVYDKTFEIYNKLKFEKKSSDLFNFYQTKELNQFEKLNFFKQELDKQFWQLQPMNSGKIKKQDTFYSMFASYYFAGDYLLCHDDIIEDRKYAFSYYLQDHNSGDLVFFNKDANKQAKRIKVRKNTLAIFEVCDQSYHQVDYTKTNGRKAITGWFNIKGISSKRVQKTIQKYIPSLPNPKNIIQYPLPSEYIEEQFFQMIDIGFQFNVKKTTLQGPFFSRRVHKIQLDQTVVFSLPGYKLFSAEFYHFKKGDYILLNDPVNTIEGNDIIDIFVTNLPEDFQRSNQDDEEEGNVLIKIVQEGDQQTNGIPEIHDSLFVVHRGKKQYYVDRCEIEFKIAHFIYFKDNSKQQKKQKNNKKNVIVPGQLQQEESNNKKQKKVKRPQNKKNNQKKKKQGKKQIKNQNRKVTQNKKQVSKAKNTRKIKKQAK